MDPAQPSSEDEPAHEPVHDHGADAHWHHHEGDWEPRPHDHLVEPVFGGLGIETDAPVAGPTARVSCQVIAVGALLLAGLAAVVWALLR